MTYKDNQNKISSSFTASHGPSLHSSTTVPVSRERRECQAPAGMFKMLPPVTRSTTTIRVPETSKKYSSQCPRTQTTVSEVSQCRWMGSTVPGSTALSIRWDLSAGEFRRPRFIRIRGFAFAWAVNSSNMCWSMIIASSYTHSSPFSKSPTSDTSHLPPPVPAGKETQADA